MSQTLQADDVVVIGAGPAGLAAASVTAGAGLGTRLLDEQPTPGGQIWRNAAAVLADPGPRRRIASSSPGAGQALRRLAASGARHHPGATVIDVARTDAGYSVTWLRRDGRQTPTLTSTDARCLILACGAQERSLIFPGWHLPGVITVGGLQTLLKQAALVPAGDGVVLAGQGPLLLLALAQLTRLGGRVAAVLDLTPPGWLDRALRHVPAAVTADPFLLAKGLGLTLRRRWSGVPVYRQVTDLRAEAETGDGPLACVRFRSGGKERVLPTRRLAVHDGVIPNTQISRLLGLDHRWDPARAAFAPVLTDEGESTAPGLWIAGDAGGVAGADLAGISGELAGEAVIARLRPDCATERAPVRDRWLRLKRRRLAARPLIDALYPALPPPGPEAEDALLCRCEGVTVAAVRAAVQAGADGPNRVKTFTRCGMGPCQGRLCGNPLTRVVARETGRSPDQVGALRIRAPVKPVLLRDYLEPEEAMHAG